MVIATASLGLKRSLPLTRLPPYSITADTSFVLKKRKKRERNNFLLLGEQKENNFIKEMKT